MSKKVWTVGFVVATLFTLSLLYIKLRVKDSQIKQLQEQVAGIEKNNKGNVSDSGLHEHMNKLLLYMNKLYFSGVNENRELTEFYIHEIEEVMEEIAAGKFMEDGVDVSKKMKSMGMVGFEMFEDEFKDSGFSGFDSSYGILVRTCNNCHANSKHPYIQITYPESPVFDNQVYKEE